MWGFVDALKRDAGAAKVILVGYSGGGAIAVLLAARRLDVAGVITVSADLDLAYWTQRDGLAPLSGSLAVTSFDHTSGVAGDRPIGR